MAEVLIQNIPSRSQPGAEPLPKHLSTSVRSLSFKYYIHDSVPTLRFQLIGDLRASNIEELLGSWVTARPTLGLRRFLVDVRQLYSADDESRRWLLKMQEEGAAFLPAGYLESGHRATPAGIPEQVAAIKLSLLGRVLDAFRGHD